ncbi:hypothetical protein [uncultured Cedecea sp.]|uniref:hypothetical protein n=1 Tax=uncultured Cedecea sp. TaxID=988762 RepID=UPI0026345DC8|nr:hypothetical protein [uncultured Cedecea sp.]
MNTITDQKPVSSSSQLHERLIILNQSVKGMLPTINTRNVGEILHLPQQTTALAWNWSKGFNY